MIESFKYCIPGNFHTTERVAVGNNLAFLHTKKFLTNWRVLYFSQSVGTAFRPEVNMARLARVLVLALAGFSAAQSLQRKASGSMLYAYYRQS